MDTDSERRFRRGLLFVASIGALWRIGMLIVDKWNQPLLLNDSLYYSAQARQLVDGVWFREIFVDRPGAEHGPLTSIALAPVSWLSDPVPWQRTMTVLFGIATIVVIGLLAKRIGGRRVGLIAAGIAAVYPNLWMNDGLVMSESLSMLMVSVVLLASTGLLTGPSPRLAIAGGVTAGLAALARSELIVLGPAVAVLIWLQARRSDRPPNALRWSPVVVPAAVLVSMLITIMPWVVFNLVRFEQRVTLTTNDGTTLLGSYCDESFNGPNRGGWSLACVVNDADYTMDEEPSVRSARQRSLAVAYARDHLGQLPAVIAARLGRTLDLYGIDSLVAQDVGEERYRWASWAGIVSWWALAFSAVRGLVVLRRRKVRWQRWLLLIPVASVLATTVLFYGGHRIRSSMEPTVIVLAAVGIAAIAKRRR